jgi:hypothetical protein
MFLTSPYIDQAWLLKKSIVLKTAGIVGIENVYPNRESRL